jgi:hypothetical protein
MRLASHKHPSNGFINVSVREHFCLSLPIWNALLFYYQHYSVARLSILAAETP